MKTALVTGDWGFIGRHMKRRLIDDGYDVSGFDIRDKWGGVDARDFFRHDFGTRHFDLVVHCAAVVGGRTKIDGAPLEVAVDLSIDAELFQWAMRTTPGALVYFSSSAAYPTAWQNNADVTYPLSEDFIDLSPDSDVGVPDQTYGWSKLTGELLAQRYVEAGGRVHVFRPFSGYGTDQDISYPFPAFIERARRGDSPFEVWGTGEQVRDFIHVNDIIDAVMVAVDQGVLGPVNLCTGRETSFNELARMVTVAAGYDAQIVHRNNAPTGVRHRVGDPAQMLKFYTPQISLEEGIERALKGIT